MDFIFTVCGQRRSRDVPIWLGIQRRRIGGLPDPSAQQGDGGRAPLAFAETHRMLTSAFPRS